MPPLILIVLPICLSNVALNIAPFGYNCCCSLVYSFRLLPVSSSRILNRKPNYIAVVPITQVMSCPSHCPCRPHHIVNVVPRHSQCRALSLSKILSQNTACESPHVWNVSPWRMCTDCRLPFTLSLSVSGSNKPCPHLIQERKVEIKP